MGLFSIDENPTYTETQSKLDMIEKIIVEYNFLNDTEKIRLIKNILNGKISEV